MADPDAPWMLDDTPEDVPAEGSEEAPAEEAPAPPPEPPKPEGPPPRKYNT
ncbi:energy transducer TonB, partial [bacterium LRH843]|nr:energy transducer TonB [bacterium LRH843]